MAIWDNIGKKASATTAKAAQQVKILTETTKLNGMISDEEKKINNRYCEIGKLYATIHREDPETELADLVAAVVESERKIKEYRIQIQDMKGVARCENCGAEVAKGAAFCSACGASAPKPAAPVRQDLEKCATCGAMVEKGMRFCTNCGKPMEVVTESAPVTQIPVKALCAICGAELQEGMTFCTNCGNAVAKAEEPIETEETLAAAEEMPAVTEEIPVLEEEPAVEEEAPEVIEEIPVTESFEVCANCGAMVEQGMRFCTTCGNSMEAAARSVPEFIDVEPIVESSAKRVCVNCGAELDDDALFCTECGTRV